MGYALPTNTDYISASWQDHRNRNPPSSEPGTDYASAYGSPLYAPGNGTVVDLKTSNGSATGRFLTIDMDDGRRTRSLHLAEIWVNVGNRVSAGQQVGITGASGHGSDWGYGAHVHQTLWDYHGYDFCSNCTIDFHAYVGSSEPGPTQRVVGTGGANGRSDPSTANAPTQTLPPGTLANFNGWINGEVVSGNNVWFRGEFSGDFFWSGGFTDTGTHDLADLNPAQPPAGNQRVVGPDGVHQRSEPSSSATSIGFLSEGFLGTYSGWINGEEVSGNDVWFQGAGGDWSWSGGFTDTGTHDLTDLNTGTPPPENALTRTVNSNPCNIRDLPYTTSPVIGSANAGSTIELSGWTHGEPVDGNDVWFERKADRDWMWSGGFTDASNTGIPEVPTPNPPSQGSVDNPRGLVEYEPIWPFAFQGLEAPLGFTDCADPVERASRDIAGGIPVDGVIDTYLIHWTGTTVDQMDWFSYCNSRTSCPTLYMRRDGSQSEMIRPGAKPATAGGDWNWRTFAIETLAGPGEDFTDEQWEAHAQNIAELARYNGKVLDGVPVEFTIDRDHVMGHRELDGQEGTECPGDAQIAGLDALLARAQEIYDGEPEPEPEPGPLDPAGYPVMYSLNGEFSRAFGHEPPTGQR
jgi:murein DD-endopeptidase MepM/ murein hydrolase activator NlpD